MLAYLAAKLLCEQKFNSHLYLQLKTKNKIERREADTYGKLKRRETSGDVSHICVCICICMHLSILARRKNKNQTLGRER